MCQPRTQVDKHLTFLNLGHNPPAYIITLLQPFRKFSTPHAVVQPTSHVESPGSIYQQEGWDSWDIFRGTVWHNLQGYPSTL